MLRRIFGRLEVDRLRLHDRKSRVYRCADGVTFLGWRLFPHKTRLVRGNIVRFSRKMRRLQRDFHAGTATWYSVRQSVQAWIGHAAFGDTTVLRQRLLDRFPFLPRLGAPSARPGGLVQQQCEESPGGLSQQQ